MPRPRNRRRKVEINILLTEDLAAALDQLLWDPVLNKPKYGARSQLIETLVTEWITAQRPELVTVTEIPEI